MASPLTQETGTAIAPRSRPQGAPVVPSSRLQLPLVLSLLTGGLLYLSYFPVACGYLAWVALVPFLFLVRSSARPRTLYLSALAGGLVFYWPAMQWMRVADDRMYVTWAFLATYCALYLPMVLYLLRFFERRSRLPLVLTLPVIWTALEFIRVHFGTGFAWYLLAHSQHDFAHAIQISDLTGAYGVSFLVAAVNALLFEVLFARTRLRTLLVGAAVPPRWSRLALLRQALVVILLLLSTFAYGAWRLGQTTGTPGPRVALIQGNLPQSIRNDSSSSQEAAHTVEHHYFFLCDLARAEKPDLIVWPETSYPDYWEEKPPGTPSLWSQNEAGKASQRWMTSVLLGMESQVSGPDEQKAKYNSAVLIDRHGHLAGRYDKMHRVPFGEYVPFRDWLPWMKKIAPYDFDYSVAAGEHHTRFPLKTKAGTEYTFGTIICYESADPDVIRPYAGSDGGPATDFVVNISNDGWFRGTSEHDQHLALCRFRAIENRRSLVRAVNMGISALIDSNGFVLAPRALPWPKGPVADRVRQRLRDSMAGDAQVWRVSAANGPLPVSDWGEYKKVSGVLVATVPIDHRGSFYARWGDYLPWGCWVVLVGGFVVALRRPRG